MKRVAVFYSVGPHFKKTLAAARRLGDRVIAIVPPHVDKADIEPLVDETVTTEEGHYTPRKVGPNRRLVKRLRDANYDAFVVMFDSPQLRLLASLSGAKSAWYCAPHGRLTQLHGAPWRVAASETARRVTGWTRYAGLWLLVRLTYVTPWTKPTDRREAPRR